MGARSYTAPAHRAIHPHVFIIDWDEILAFAGFRVVQLDCGHGASYQGLRGMAAEISEENDVSKPAEG